MIIPEKTPSCVGVSDDTPEKLKRFESILKVCVNASAVLRERYKMDYNNKDRPFWYEDMTAGPGCYYLPDGIPSAGSPIIAFRALRDCYYNNRQPFKAIFHEKQDKTRKILKENLEDECSATPELWDWIDIDDDYMKLGIDTIIPKMIIGTDNSPVGVTKNNFGMMYFDNNGGCIGFKNLQNLYSYSNFAEKLQRVDILLHLSAGNLVRSCTSTQKYCDIEKEKRSPADCILPLLDIKKYLYVSAPVNRINKWVFILLSNYKGYKDRWKKCGFVSSDEAVDRINELFRFKKEKEEMGI